MTDMIYIIFVLFMIVDAYVLVYCIRFMNDLERRALEKKSVEMEEDDG